MKKEVGKNEENRKMKRTQIRRRRDEKQGAENTNRKEDRKDEKNTGA